MTALVDELRQFTQALFDCLLLLGKQESADLFFRSERHFCFGQCRGGLIALLAHIFQSCSDVRGFLLLLTLAGFKLADLGGEGGAFLRSFLLLGGKALDLVDHRLDLLVEQSLRTLQRVELALMRGNGNFLLAQFLLRLLQPGLQ